MLHFQLKQPKRSGRIRNMANVVKKRIDNREFQKTDAREEQDEEYEGKSSSARDLFLAAVNAKLEDGNISAATRILCSQDHPVKATPDTFAAMQEKHPSDKWASKLMDLSCVAHTVPYQASEKEVADAVRSFPAGSVGGPNGLRPQHLLDLLNNQESPASFLASLTDFINILLRGECPKEETSETSDIRDIGHPRQRRDRVMKRIPKGARFACSKVFCPIKRFPSYSSSYSSSRANPVVASVFWNSRLSIRFLTTFAILRRMSDDICLTVYTSIVYFYLG